MEKIIIRDKIVMRGYTRSNFKSLSGDYDFRSMDEFIKKHNIIKIMNDLYKENIEAEKLEDDIIYTKYKEVLNGSEENDFFKIAYKVEDKFYVSLSENTYLYHLIKLPEIDNKKVVPWEYADGRMYFGDTWWFKNEEILHDLKNISITEFLIKYRLN